MQAAFLSEKLPHLEHWNSLRMQSAALYDDLLAATDVVLPGRAEGVNHVFHLYVIRVKDRHTLRAELADRGIQTGIHYPVPLHLEPAFSYLGYARGEFPVAEAAASSMVSLPMYPFLSYDEVARVAQAVGEVAHD